MNEKPPIDDMIDMQQMLQSRLWAGEYYERGIPIVRLLGDLTMSIYRRTVEAEHER